MATNRSILITGIETVNPVIRFTGGHVSKRELLRIQRALVLGYRQNVKEYRTNQRIESNKKVEVTTNAES
jgi:hypothetical protein